MLDIYLVDAFTNERFKGNPAAVCLLEKELDHNLYLKISSEMNLSETAFVYPLDGKSWSESHRFSLRWFTPKVEVPLCGHATLASAHVLFRHLNYPGTKIRFESNSGPLYVSKSGDMITLDFPAATFRKVDPPDELVHGIGKTPLETYLSTDYLILLGSEHEVREIRPDFPVLAGLDIRGIIITAVGEKADFVSRFFAPSAGINEDPVTGSAHTFLVPFWAEKLGKTEFTARQLSRRGGTLYCKLAGERVEISGLAITFLEGELKL